jgi:uncharacterized protein (TIGR02246 family)
MSSDEADIIRRTREFAAAWNKGDAEAAAGFFAEDGVRVGAMGDTQHGRAEVRDAYERLLGGPLSGASVTQEDGDVRMLGPDLAVWRAGIEIRPAAGAPAMKGHVVQVMKKVSGRWMVLEAHPKLFPPPPS